MKRRYAGLTLLMTIAVAGSLFPGLGGATAAADSVVLERWIQTTVADFSTGAGDGIWVTAEKDGGLRLLEGRESGAYLSAVHETTQACQAAGLLYGAQTPAGAALLLELRGQDEGGEWTPWTAFAEGPWRDPAGRAVGEALLAFPPGVRRLQYRVSLVGKKDSPVLEEVEVVCLSAAVATTVEAEPPWREDDSRPEPVWPEAWGAEVVTATVAITGTSVPRQIELHPAVLSWSEEIEPVALLRMVQRFQREVLGQEDMPYHFLVDSQGRVYRGRPASGEVLSVGILGAHPREAVSPTVEDALVALLDWWQATALSEGGEVELVFPADPGLAERLVVRQQAGNLRRNEWLLARGATGPGMDAWILLTNPDSQRTRVTAELHREDGRWVRRTLPVEAGSRASLYANQTVSAARFWTRVWAEGDVLVERALYYGHDGDDSVGLEGLSRRWYLPGGSQEAGYTTTLTLLNPSREAATVTVTVFAPAGLAGEAEFRLEPQTRLDLPVREVYTGATPVGCQVTASLPIAVEQEVRFSAAEGGYGMPGTPFLSSRWTLAGVETKTGFVTVLALLNPHPQPVTVTLTLMSEDGTTLKRLYRVRPGEQRLNLNTLLPELALAVEVEASQPIAVARITLFNELRSAQATLGAVRPARRWYLPEGSTAEPFETFLQLANANRVPTLVEVVFMGRKGELGRVQLPMPACSRLTVAVSEILPDVSAFSTYVEAEWPVVVERTMYLHERQGGHSCLGIAR